MSTHPSAADLQRYRHRDLPAAELLQMDDHVHLCEACRRSVLEDVDLLQDVTDLQAQFESHAVLVWSRSRAAFLGAAALVGVVILAVWTLARTPRSGNEPLSGRLEASPGAPVSGPPGGPGSASDRLPEPVLVRDVPGVVGIDAGARLVGLPGLPPPARDLVATVLVSGRLAIGAAIPTLPRGPRKWRSSREPVTFSLLAPVGTAVSDPRPTFRWTPIEGALGYVVSVSDGSFNLVAQSGSLADTQWRPDRALTRGRVYLWQVTARTPQGQTTAPAPLEPEAAFRVLGEDELRELDLARGAATGSHLALTVLYASRGLLDDAETELTALAALNPGSSRVGALLADLRAKRQGRPSS